MALFLEKSAQKSGKNELALTRLASLGGFRLKQSIFANSGSRELFIREKVKANAPCLSEEHDVVRVKREPMAALCRLGELIAMQEQCDERVCVCLDFLGSFLIKQKRTKKKGI